MTSATCNYEWPKDEFYLHRCAEVRGHGDVHTCRCKARREVTG